MNAGKNHLKAAGRNANAGRRRWAPGGFADTGHASSDAEFLRNLSKRIMISDLDALSEEAGFHPPNSFDFGRMREILAVRRFPVEEEIEYSWALYECGYSSWFSFNSAVQVFVSSVFVYCNARQPLGLRVESDFYYLGVNAVVHDDRDLAADFFYFIDRVCAPGDGFDSDSKFYFGVLSRCLIAAKFFPEKTGEIKEALRSFEPWVAGKSVLDISHSVRGLSLWRALAEELVLDRELLDAFTRALPRGEQTM